MTTDDSERCEAFEFAVCVGIIGILCLIGFIGNFVSFRLFQKHKPETASVLLMRYLSVSDSVLLLTTILIYTVYSILEAIGEKTSIQRWGDVQSYIWPVALIAQTTTIWLTVLLTWNRYRAICLPYDLCHSEDVRKTRLQFIALLIFSIIYNIPRFFEHEKIGTDYVDTNLNGTNVTITASNLGDNKIYQIVYSNVIYFPIMYVIPMLSLMYLNYGLVRALNELKRRKEALTSHRPKEDHITVCIIVIVFVFFLCQTPALINQIFWATNSADERQCGRFHFYYTKLSDVLVVFNSSVNFVIYCFFGKTFRKILIESLREYKCLSGNSRSDDGVITNC